MTAPVQTFFLEPLSPIQLKTLLETEAGSIIPEAAIIWIEKQTQGNPLFSLEYFKWLARLGFLRSDGQFWRWREPEHRVLPSKLDALIEQALMPALVSEQQAHVLLAAALLGSEVDLSVLSQVTQKSQTELKEIFLRLERFGVFRRGQFAHSLYKEVLLNNPNIKNRELIIRQVLTFLAKHNPIEATQMMHFAKLNPTEQGYYFEQAITFALNLPDPVLAARLRRKSIELVDRLAQVPLLLESALWLQPYQLSETLEITDLLSSLEPLNTANLRLRVILLAKLGRTTEAQGILHSLPLKGLNDLIELEVLVLYRGCQYTKLLELWRVGLAAQIDLPAALARAVVIALLYVAEFEIAQQIMSRTSSLTGFDRLSILFAELHLLFTKHDFATTIAACTDFLGQLEPYRNATFEWIDLLCGTLHLRALAYSALGRPLAAIEDTTKNLGYLKQLGHSIIYAQRKAELALYQIQAGESGLAATNLFEASETLDYSGEPIQNYFYHQTRAIYYLGLEDQKALQIARLALRHAQETEEPNHINTAKQTLALIEASLGSGAKALDLVSQLEPPPRLTKAIALKRLGQSAEAIRLLEETLQLGAASNEPTGRMQLELAHLKNDFDFAQKLLEQFNQNHQGQLIKLLQFYFPDFSRPKKPALRVLGDIYWHDTPLGERGRKALELLVYLLEARVEKQPVVALEELFRVLYRNHQPAEAKAALKQLVYRMRGFLGAEAILHLGQGYALGAFETDLELFLEHPQPELLLGNYINDLGTDHPSSLRQVLMEKIQTLLSEMMQHNHPETVRIARILLEMNSPDHKNLTLILKAVQHAKDPVAAIQIYAHAKQKLEEMGEDLPDSWQKYLQSH